MSRVTLKGHILVPQADLAAVRRELPRHIELTRSEAGCLAFDVEQDAAAPHKFYVHEIFSSRKAFEAHQARVKKSEWGKVSASAERHYDISDGH